MASLIFVDTAWWKALLDPRDDFHDRASRQKSQIIEQKRQLVTSNYVVDETLTLIRNRVKLPCALEFRDLLSAMAGFLKIIRVSAADESAAWQWFEKDWSKLSYTDCVSFAMMQRMELTEVATFDEHFTRAGFKALE